MREVHETVWSEVTVSRRRWRKPIVSSSGGRSISAVPPGLTTLEATRSLDAHDGDGGLTRDDLIDNAVRTFGWTRDEVVDWMGDLLPPVEDDRTEDDDTEDDRTEDDRTR